MLDACTNKVCLIQRAAILANYNDLITGGARLTDGPLGASYGNDMSNTLLSSVTELSLPAANAVNDGAKRGMHLLRNAGRPIAPNKHQKKLPSDQTIVQVAKLATSLWRTINGELGGKLLVEKGRKFAPVTGAVDGVCAYDGYYLRCSLLSLWQCVWPNR